MSVDPSTIAAVRAALAAIEEEEKVRILFAVESGSRAWGFASPDSDYDVRFFYVPAWERYFTVLPERDVIERELPGDLDLSGWELRKALQLFFKGNGAMNEWLGSPVVYTEVPGFADSLRSLLPVVFNPARILFHYLGLARLTLEGSLREPEVRLKKLFYVLRPLFAARWIVETRAMPPTPFADLVAAPWVSDEERAWVAELLVRKASLAEADRIELPEARRAALAMEVERLAALGPALAVQRPRDSDIEERLDSILVRWAGPAGR